MKYFSAIKIMENWHHKKQAFDKILLQNFVQ